MKYMDVSLGTKVGVDTILGVYWNMKYLHGQICTKWVYLTISFKRQLKIRVKQKYYLQQKSVFSFQLGTCIVQLSIQNCLDSFGFPCVRILHIQYLMFKIIYKFFTQHTWITIGVLALSHSIIRVSKWNVIPSSLIKFLPMIIQYLLVSLSV